MLKMEVQYVYEGKTDLSTSKYSGMYKDLKVNVKKESNALRDEWTKI